MASLYIKSPLACLAGASVSGIVIRDGRIAELPGGHGRAGHLDERAAALESLTAIKRAGADLVFSYWTKDLATWL